MPEEETPYAWLDPAQVAEWVKVDPEADNAGNVELARQAAADWIQDQRPDLWVTVTVDDEEVTTFAATPRILEAGLIVTGRLLTRAGNLSGLVNYGEFAGSVLRNDPDVRMLLGLSKKLVKG
jgi:hypothetical protein